MGQYREREQGEREKNTKLYAWSISASEGQRADSIDKNFVVILTSLFNVKDDVKLSIRVKWKQMDFPFSARCGGVKKDRLMSFQFSEDNGVRISFEGRRERREEKSLRWCVDRLGAREAKRKGEREIERKRTGRRNYKDRWFITFLLIIFRQSRHFRCISLFISFSSH